MQLTDQDKSLLLRMGYIESELRQIEDACNEARITLTNDKGENRRITAKVAARILGREQFLSGISRAAFHCTATRDTPEGDGVHFDLSCWWR